MASPGGGHQDIVADPVEELLQVEVHDDVAPVGNVLLGLGECLMDTPARRKPKLDAENVGSRIGSRTSHWDLQDRLLHEAVHHHRDAQLAHPAARLGDLHPRTVSGR
jgi:hypothetical protein